MKKWILTFSALFAAASLQAGDDCCEGACDAKPVAKTVQKPDAKKVAAKKQAKDAKTVTVAKTKPVASK